MDLPPVAPRGVRFAPDDIEVVVDFLEPFVNNQNFDGNLVKEFDLYLDYPERLEHDYEKYFPNRHYWYYVRRQRLPNIDRPNRHISREPLAKWRYHSTVKLIRAKTELVGHKELLQLLTPHGIKTGWFQAEYRMASPDFQTIVLVHVYYDINSDQRAAAAAYLGVQNNVLPLPVIAPNANAVGPQQQNDLVVGGQNNVLPLPVIAPNAQQQNDLVGGGQNMVLPLPVIAPNAQQQNDLVGGGQQGLRRKCWLLRCFGV